MKSKIRGVVIFSFFIVFVCLSALLYGCGERNKLEFEKKSVVLYCGETYKIADVNRLNFESQDISYLATNSYLLVNDDRVTALHIGKSRVYASLNGVTTHFDVTIKGFYADNVTFDKSELYINNNESSENLATLPIDYDMPYQVSYSDDKYITYDVATGQVSSIYSGESLKNGSIAIEVTLSYFSSANTRQESSFIVHYSTYDYVNKISINDYLIESSGVVEATMFVGDELIFPISILDTCTFMPTISDNDLSLVFAGNNTYDLHINPTTVGVKSYEIKIESGMKNGKFTYITTTFNITVIDRINITNMKIYYGDNVVPYGELYVSEKYELRIYTLAKLDNYESTNGYYSFEISFSKSGEYKINKTLYLTTDSGVDSFVVDLEVMVYDKLTDFDVLCGDTTLLDTATIYLIDDEYIKDAIENDIISNLSLSIDMKDDYYYGDIVYDSSNDNIEINGNDIIPKAIGSTTLYVSLGGRYKISKEYTIFVSQIEKQAIELSTKDITLYEQNDKGYQDRVRVNYSVFPNYAYNKGLNIYADSECFTFTQYEGYIDISFVKVGEGTLFIDNKSINIKCLPIIDDIYVSSGNAIESNFTAIYSTTLVISIFGKRNDEKFTIPYDISLGLAYEKYDNSIVIVPKNLGKFVCQICMQGITKEITINVLESTVKSVAILNRNTNVAMNGGEYNFALSLSVLLDNGTIINDFGVISSYVKIVCDRDISLSGDYYTILETGEYHFTVCSIFNSSIFDEISLSVV